MDPLSEALSHLSTQSSFFAGLRAGGAWRIDFPPPSGIKFNAVVEGGCWLVVEGVEPPIRLEAGDCFLLSRSRAFTLASDLAAPAVEAAAAYRDAVHGVASHGVADAPGRLFLIGGRFAFGDEAGLLVDGLPPVAVVRQGSDQASVLHWALQQLSGELTQPSPGSALLVQHLGHMMLVQMLRLYLAQEGAGSAPSWLLALSDARLGAVLQAIHAEPARRWTLADLAGIAHMSRSTLALRFKEKAGLAPLEYVLRWRMQLATRALRSRHGATVSSIAHSLGYDSDSAFSNAFKRVMACSPRAYRQLHGMDLAAQPA